MVVKSKCTRTQKAFDCYSCDHFGECWHYVCLHEHQPSCQGQNWAVVTLLIHNRYGDSIRSNLPTDLPISAVVHTGWLVSLALCCTLFLSSPLTDQGYRWLLSAIRCCVADVTAFIVTMIYWFRMTTATGKNTSKRPGTGEGKLLNANSSNNFHPVPLRTAHFASGYCLAICCLPSRSDYQLSKHRVGAKCRHLPFAPLIQTYWVFSVRSSPNSFEERIWQRFISTGILLVFNSWIISNLSVLPLACWWKYSFGVSCSEIDHYDKFLVPPMCSKLAIHLCRILVLMFQVALFSAYSWRKSV